jgi:hypothetical protein
MSFDRGTGAVGTGEASILSVSQGGTGADNATDARVNLGFNSANIINTTQLTDGSVTPVKLSTGGLSWTTTGSVGIGTGSPAASLHVIGKTGQFTGYFANGSATGLGLLSLVNSNNTTGTYFEGISLVDSATKFVVYSNGNVVNANNSYGAISDEKFKENIVDSTPKLEKLNQVRVVNFNMIGSTQKQLGVIAQEVEQIFPSIVEEASDRGSNGEMLETTHKMVKYSVFVPILIKAIQELKTELDSVKTELAILKET